MLLRRQLHRSCDKCKTISTRICMYTCNIDSYWWCVISKMLAVVDSPVNNCQLMITMLPAMITCYQRCLSLDCQNLLKSGATTVLPRSSFLLNTPLPLLSPWPYTTKHVKTQAGHTQKSTRPTILISRWLMQDKWKIWYLLGYFLSCIFYLVINSS